MPAHWSGRLGGAEIQARFLLGYLRENTDHDLSVVCRHTKVSVDDGVPVHRIRTMWPLARHTFLLDYWSVQHLLRKIDPDVIYTRVGSPLVGYAARFCKHHGKALVHHIARLDDVLPRSTITFRNSIRRLERRIYEFGLLNADAVVAQAQYQARLLASHFSRAEAEVVPNFHPAPDVVPAKNQAPRIVLWVANLKSAKRPEVFLELARKCQSISNVRFIMVGAMSDPAYADEIKKAGELGHFDYAGPMPLEDVNRLMASAHLLVNTSVEVGEGFPNTFVQAWLRGVPVISFQVDPDSLLAGGEIGLCSGGSIDQLVQDVTTLLADPVRLTQMGELSRRHALRNYGVANLHRLQVILERAADAARISRSR